MTAEEIIQAISDDQMMPFIQPEQLAQIVAFVINNYKPSLPSNIDEAAHDYAWEKQDMVYDADGERLMDYGPRYDAFKAGAEWMAEQGETQIVETKAIFDSHGIDYGGRYLYVDLPDDTPIGTEFIVQIRKKEENHE